MGKRELLLIVGFVVWASLRLSADRAAAPPGGRVSASADLPQHAGATSRATRESATARRARRPCRSTRRLSEVADQLRRGRATSRSSARSAPTSARADVGSNGFDEAEAKAPAKAVTLKIERAADAVVVALTLRGSAARQRVAIVVCSRCRRRLGHADRAALRRLDVSRTWASARDHRRAASAVRDIAGRGRDRTRRRARGDDVASLEAHRAQQPRHREASRGAVDARRRSGGELAPRASPGRSRSKRGTPTSDRRARGRSKAPVQAHGTGGECASAAARTDRGSTAATPTSRSRSTAPAPVTIYNDGERFE